MFHAYKAVEIARHHCISAREAVDSAQPGAGLPLSRLGADGLKLVSILATANLRIFR